MKNLKRILSLILAAQAAWPSGALAAFDEVGVGARTTGLGNAFTAVADDVYTVHYNPAGLATLGRPELATTYSKLLTGLSDNSSLQNSFIAYAHPLQGGRQGTIGSAWNYFTLDSLYKENTLYFSYGRGLFAGQLPQKLYGGVSLKYLGRALGGTSAASSAIGPTGIATGQEDPVLKNASRSALDADLGFLYRVRPRWTAGVMFQHLLEPNIAFSPNDTDTLGRNIKLGGSYKTPFSTLAADVGFLASPDGGTDKSVSFAAEKWLPTLVHGTFGVRGALTVGDRSLRQLAMGLSYKIFRMQFDYGFVLPLGGIDGTAGTHRLGLTYRFGRPSAVAEATLSEALLENLRELAQVGTPEFRYQMEDLALFKRTAIEEFLRQAKVDVAAGRFADAQAKLAEASALKPGDPRLSASEQRLKAIAEVYPELKDFQTDAAQAAIYEGAMEFLAGKDKEALRKLAYAQSLNAKDEKLEVLMQVVESKSGVVREATQLARPSAGPTLGAEKVVGGTLALLEVALREREYDKVIKLARQVIELDPANALAYKRLGAAYYALKNYPDALKALRSSLKLETGEEERKALRSYIDALAALIEQAARREREAVRGPAPAPAARTPQEIERLYETGVDLYAQGRLAEAAQAFKQILEIEPGNVSARRALDRVQSEMLQGGRR